MNNQLKLPNINKPCPDCPFTKNCLEGWLGKKRITKITESNSFVCHKDTSKQCAGFMLLMGMRSRFFSMAKRLNLNLNLSGHEKVFDSVQDCIDHHSE